MELIILGVPILAISGIVILFICIKVLLFIFGHAGDEVDKVSVRAADEYGESKSIHEHSKKMARLKIRDTVGEGSEEKTDQAIQDAKDVAIGAAKLAGKGAWLGAKATAYGLKTAHQLYFNTDEAVEKVKKDWDSIPDKVDKFKTTLEEKTQRTIEVRQNREARRPVEANEHCPCGSRKKYKNCHGLRLDSERVRYTKTTTSKKAVSDDPSEYVSLQEFSKHAYMPESTIIEMIRAGTYQGRKFDGEWKVHYSEIEKPY